MADFVQARSLSAARASAIQALWAGWPPTLSATSTLRKIKTGRLPLDELGRPLRSDVPRFVQRQQRQLQGRHNDLRIRDASYKAALAWATITQLAGIAPHARACRGAREDILPAKGLVPDAVAASPVFLGSAALGAGLTVLLATVLGLPVSTTHGLTGALIGAGLATGAGVNLGVLGKSFVLPLLLSPLLAVATSAALYPVAHLRGGASASSVRAAFASARSMSRFVSRRRAERHPPSRPCSWPSRPGMAAPSDTGRCRRAIGAAGTSPRSTSCRRALCVSLVASTIRPRNRRSTHRGKGNDRKRGPPTRRRRHGSRRPSRVA